MRFSTVLYTWEEREEAINNKQVDGDGRGWDGGETSFYTYRIIVQSLRRVVKSQVYYNVIGFLSNFVNSCMQSFLKDNYHL